MYELAHTYHQLVPIKGKAKTGLMPLERIDGPSTAWDAQLHHFPESNAPYPVLKV